MTTKEKVARRKLSLLELAKELDNVSRACKVMGYSRQQFYEIRRNFQTYGAQGLLDRLPGPRGPHPNRQCWRIGFADRFLTGTPETGSFGPRHVDVRTRAIHPENMAWHSHRPAACYSILSVPQVR